MQGYVTNSVVDIYTHREDNETLNIIHFHVNDTSDSVTLEVKYMHDNENLEEHKEFGVDMQGRPLKYKIIVKNCKIFTVMYKEATEEGEVIEIPFRENTIEPTAQYVTKSNESGIQYFG